MDANLDNNKWDPKYYKKCAHRSRTTCKYDKDCGLQTHPQGQFFYFLPQKEMLRSTLQNPPPPQHNCFQKTTLSAFSLHKHLLICILSMLIPLPHLCKCLCINQATNTNLHIILKWKQ